MRYLLLIYEEPPATPPTPEEWAAMMPAYDAFTTWVTGRGWMRGGEALADVSAATTVTVRDGRPIITDGPFAETKEHLGGYYILDVPSLDDALDAAARVPGARTGKIEVRPIVETG